ncbi:MAG: hypothetical protein SF029_04200 [bacterium]|nr:hypothetical protein [bacterium]
MNTKKVGIVVLLIVALAIFAGVVGAQQPGGEPGGRGEGRRGGRGGERILLTVVAEQTGLTAQEIITQVRDGATLAEVITANGGDVEAVTAAVVEALTTEINEAVAAGRITQAQADERLATLEADVTAALNGERDDFGRGPGGRGWRGVERGILNLAAEQTGLTREEIVTQLRGGATLATILTENGVEVDAFVDAVIEQAEAQLAEAVTAGRITQEQADERLAALREGLEERINTPLTGEREDSI